MHKTKIDLNALYEFFVSSIDADALIELRNHESYASHTIAMNQIKGGLDIWGSGSVRANELRQEFKEQYYAHPSSNHNNERLVKIASRMQDTGKSEITANIYLIAANNFIVNLIDDKPTGEDDVDIDDDDNDNTPSNNTLEARNKRSNQRYYKGFHRLDGLFSVLEQKMQQYASAYIKLAMTPNDINTIKKQLKSKQDNIKSQKINSDVTKFMINYGKATNNARIRKPFGRIVPDILDGWMPYWGTITVANRDNNSLRSEFETRGLLAEYDNNNITITQLKKLLKDNETTRFEETIMTALTNSGLNANADATTKNKLQQLKEHWDECQNNNTACAFDWNDFIVDMDGKFKVQCEAVHNYFIT